MNSRRNYLGKYSQEEEKPGNLRSCGCARRYLPSPPLGSPPTNGPGRSRSSTGSSGGGELRGIKSRSRTPSNLSSGRTTPSPTRGNGNRTGMGDRTVSETALLNLEEPPKIANPRFVSTFNLKPRSLSAQYTTTVLIRIGSSRHHHIEEIKYEVRLTPNKPTICSTETEEKNKKQPEKRKTRHFRTEFEVEIQQPDKAFIKIHQPSVKSESVHENKNHIQANDTEADGAHIL